MGRRFRLSLLLIMVVALPVAAVPVTTHAGQPHVYQDQYQGRSAHGSWDSCSDKASFEPGDVCTYVHLTFGQSRVNGRSADQPGRTAPWLFFSRQKVIFNSEGYFESLSRTLGYAKPAGSYDFEQPVAGATIDIVLPVERCTGDGACVEEKLRLQGTWVGIGERQHETDTYRWDSTFSRIRTHFTGWWRDAAAELTIDGERVEGANDGGLLTDTREGSFDISYDYDG